MMMKSESEEQVYWWPNDIAINHQLQVIFSAPRDVLNGHSSSVLLQFLQ